MSSHHWSNCSPQSRPPGRSSVSVENPKNAHMSVTAAVDGFTSAASSPRVRAWVRSRVAGQGPDDERRGHDCVDTSALRPQSGARARHDVLAEGARDTEAQDDQFLQGIPGAVWGAASCGQVANCSRATARASFSLLE